ncbi:MAG: hypothetical protein EOP50_11705 [Sphingobacteriales bacterium]|nr:MAG: hypothetical protein EOP50_11705 [Sphingobacteriales bacterium]
MFKLIFVVLAVGAFFFRAQSRNASRRAQNDTRRRAKQLLEGSFDTLASELDLPVRRKGAAGFAAERLEAALTGKQPGTLGEKFHFLDLRKGPEGALLVLTDGKTTELVPTRSGTELVDRFYSCCLYMHTEGELVVFRSSFPDDKEHQYLLEDLADTLYALGLEKNN